MPENDEKLVVVGHGERGATGDHGQDGLAGPEGPEGPRGKAGKDAPIHPWRWTALTIWVVIFTLTVGWAVRTNRELGEDGEQAKNAICAIEKDLNRRVAVSEEFLRDNPGPVVLGNVPRSTIQSSLKGQRETIKAIEASGLDCP